MTASSSIGGLTVSSPRSASQEAEVRPKRRNQDSGWGNLSGDRCKAKDCEPLSGAEDEELRPQGLRIGGKAKDEEPLPGAEDEQSRLRVPLPGADSIMGSRAQFFLKTY